MRVSTGRTDGDRRSDTELLLAAVEDPEAFGVFYQRNFTTMISYFWARTRDRDDASDLTAETFASALQAIHRYDPQRGTPGQWLHGIAANQLKKFWRRNRASDRARRRLQIRTPPTAATGWEAIEAAEARLDGPHLAAALDRLPITYREPVALRVIERCDYAVISQRLGCSVGAARVRVMRGLRRLEVEFDRCDPMGGTGR
ncbi:MAG: sigma-70 family RNA polymerase sigma factor [Actinomycetota bacterium]